MTGSLSLFVRAAALAIVAVALAACGGGVAIEPGSLTQLPRGARPIVDNSGPPLQCVPFARRQSGIQIFGDAHTWWDQAQGRYETDRSPRPGAVIVMRNPSDSDRGHVAVVRKVLNDRQVTVDHANWRGGNIQLDSPVMDVSADNDWSLVRVWNIQAGRFGGNNYPVEGFILPERRSASGILW